MTPDQKYMLAFHQAFDPGAHVVNTFRAAFEQAANGQPHYGQGWGAYEKRFAAGELDQITGSTLIHLRFFAHSPAPGPALLSSW